MRFYAVPSMPPRRPSDSAEVVMPVYTTAEEYIRVREYERHCDRLDRERFCQGAPAVIGAICIVAVVVLLIYKIAEG